MDKRKVFFIIVLVLLALVYIGGTVWGATRSDGGGFKFDPTQIANQLGGIQESLAKPPSVAPKELRVNLSGSTSADCVRLQNTLIAPLNQTCTFTVLPVEEASIGIHPAVRKLQLTLIQGDAAALTWQGQVRQDNGNLIKVKIDKDFLPAGIVKLDVYQPGGSLTLICQKSAVDGLCRFEMSQ
jgi:hypothetical protein